MTIIDGDILNVTHGYILHQVNCLGATGGLAGALRRKWPEKFKGYSDVCKWAKQDDDLESLLGSFVASDGWPSLVHVFGQFAPGPNTDYYAVDEALGCVSVGIDQKYPVHVPTEWDVALEVAIGRPTWPF